MQKKFPPRRIWVVVSRIQYILSAQQMQPNPQTSHQGRASTDINSSNLDSNEALIGESKQGTQNDNVETSSSRTQQQDYERKEDLEKKTTSTRNHL